MKHRKLLISLICVLMIACAAAPAVLAEEGLYVDTSDFYGKKIGIPTGSIYVKDINNIFLNADIIYFDSSADALKSVESGKVDGYVNDNPALAIAASKFNGLEVKEIEGYEDPLAFITKKTEGGSKYLKEFNEYVDKITKSGELKELETAWYYNYTEDLAVGPLEELTGENGVITIATDPSGFPFEFIKNGNIDGFEIDIMYRFCKEYGYGLEIKNASFSTILPGVAAGKYDFGVSCFSITEERKQSVDFTSPISSTCAAIVYNTKNFTSTSTIWERIIRSFKGTFLTEKRWEMFLSGALTTLLISVLSIIAGTISGLLMHIICRKNNAVIVSFSKFARWLVGGLPEIVLLMILYYVVFGKSTISGIWVAVIGFTIIITCSVQEMMETSEASLDKGQALAAAALGYSENQAYVHVIFPQSLRIFLPMFLNSISSYLKATAIVGYVAVVDLTKAGDVVRGITYDAFFPLISVAVIYFLLAGILRIVVKHIIRKTDYTARSESQILKGAKIV